MQTLSFPLLGPLRQECLREAAHSQLRAELDLLRGVREEGGENEQAIKPLGSPQGVSGGDEEEGQCGQGASQEEDR